MALLNFGSEGLRGELSRKGVTSVGGGGITSMGDNKSEGKDIWWGAVRAGGFKWGQSSDVSRRGRGGRSSGVRAVVSPGKGRSSGGKMVAAGGGVVLKGTANQTETWSEYRSDVCEMALAVISTQTCQFSQNAPNKHRFAGAELESLDAESFCKRRPKR